MDFTAAQEDMRQSYFGGAPGAIVSGAVWLIAGTVARFTTEQSSALVLFLGGMLIHPLGIVISKILKRSGKHKKENPLAVLSLESTFFMFFGLFIAFAVFQIRPDWFFPILLLVIGGRYLVFSTIYGMRIYWLLGLSLALAGSGSVLLNAAFYQGALMGGAIEVIFACVIFYVEHFRKKVLEK